MKYKNCKKITRSFKASNGVLFRAELYVSHEEKEVTDAVAYSGILECLPLLMTEIGHYEREHTSIEKISPFETGRIPPPPESLKESIKCWIKEW